MNFALLGDDRTVLPLIRAIASNAEHDVRYVVASNDVVSELLRADPKTRRAGSWDELLSVEDVDVVIIAGADAEILEGAKQLAANGKGLIVFPDASQGSTWIYELSLVHDDTGVVLFPAFIARSHQQVRQIRKMLDEGIIGNVLHIRMERAAQISERTGSAALLAAGDIEGNFLPDVDLLRFLGGSYNRVTALYSGQTSDGIASATITLGGEGLPEAVWLIQPSPAAAQYTLQIVGSTGRLTLTGGDALSIPQLETDGLETDGINLVAESDTTGASELAIGNKLLQQFITANEGQATDPDWTDLTRAFEICDGVRRSIRRRRTIDLHFESTSERNQFKTQMTAIGCGLLSVTLFSLIFVLLAGTLVDPRDHLEVRAQRAGSIVLRNDFIDDSAEVDAKTEKRLEQIAPRLEQGSFMVLVEQSADSSTDQANSDLDTARRDAVVTLLKRFGAKDADKRTVIQKLSGRGFQILMTVARTFVFLPLVIFLLLQLLVFVARPSTAASSSSGTEPELPT